MYVVVLNTPSGPTYGPVFSIAEDANSYVLSLINYGQIMTPKGVPFPRWTSNVSWIPQPFDERIPKDRAEDVASARAGSVKKGVFSKTNLKRAEEESLSAVARLFAQADS
jgi:hypothetical protein